jgi:hypothetical protein
MRRAIIAALALTWLVTFGAVRRAEAERLYGHGYSYRLGVEILTSFDSVTPGITGPLLPITGLKPNELLVGIDFRPATGQLYAVSASSIYTINPDTGAATFVAALSSTLHGAGAGMDFDPVADRLRVLVDSDPNNKNNKLINVDTGEVVDGEFSFDAAANSAGDAAPLFGIAYSNNSAGATSATLFGVTNSFDRFNLAVEGPHDSGIFHIVGRLNNPLDSGNTVAVGFDISGLTGLAYILAYPKPLPGQTFFTSYVHLFTVNLSTGETADVGTVGNEQVFFTGLAAPVAPRNESEDDARSFVRRHYYDFLSRDPDAPGLAFWTEQIEACGTDARCREVKRIKVSAAFFLSIEFQETGCLAYRTYKAAFGDMPGAPVPLTFFGFLPARQQLGEGVVVGQGAWRSRLEENKVAFFNSVVSGRRFTSLLLLAPAQFVDTLNQRTGGSLTAGERDALVAELAAADTAEARGRVLRKVAENAEFKRREMNRAFVLMEYLGYLRRNPADPPELTLDYQGYAYWLEKLDRFGGNYVEAEMVKAFISSDEYRKRFRPQ